MLVNVSVPISGPGVVCDARIELNSPTNPTCKICPRRRSVQSCTELSAEIFILVKFSP
jgi:hypothetical protein